MEMNKKETQPFEMMAMQKETISGFSMDQSQVMQRETQGFEMMGPMGGQMQRETDASAFEMLRASEMTDQSQAIRHA